MTVPQIYAVFSPVLALVIVGILMIVHKKGNTRFLKSIPSQTKQTTTVRNSAAVQQHFAK